MELEYIDENLVNQIFKKSNLIKFVTLFDLLTSIFYILFVPFYGFAGIFCFMFSFIGYASAKNLDKSSILLYTLYLVFQNIIRITLFALIIWKPSFFSISDLSLLGIIINSILIFANIFFNYLVFSLYNLIKDYNQHFLHLLVEDPEYIVSISNPV